MVKKTNLTDKIVIGIIVFNLIRLENFEGYKEWKNSMQAILIMRLCHITGLLISDICTRESDIPAEYKK